MIERPLFVLSLPRSGSTLVQRVLAAHQEIATAPEPWILLPQVYAMREYGLYAEYGQVQSARAIGEFAARLPGGEASYWEEVGAFITGLYSRTSGEGARYFLDKTPRYHLIAAELPRIFPNGRYIFLWRNPLAVVASIAETWAQGRWAIEQRRVDLFDGIASLVSTYETLEDRSVAVRFEELVTEPLTTWPRIFEYLELPFDPNVLTTFDAVRLEARMGDAAGSRRYSALSTEPIDKWKRTLGGPVRKRWCRRYLRWIGRERLALMGYDLDRLLDELGMVQSTTAMIGSDLARSSYGWMNRLGREGAARVLWSQRRQGLDR